jgi:hypothetical protein
MSESWSRLDVVMLVLAISFPVWACASHFYDEKQTHVAGHQVLQNVRAIAVSTNAYHDVTDRWSPVSAKGQPKVRISPISLMNIRLSIRIWIRRCSLEKIIRVWCCSW